VSLPIDRRAIEGCEFSGGVYSDRACILRALLDAWSISGLYRISYLTRIGARFGRPSGDRRDGTFAGQGWSAGFICSLGPKRELPLFWAARGNLCLRVEKTGYNQVTLSPCVIGPEKAKRVDLTLEATKVSQAQNAAPAKSAAGSPEFFDEPQFTVAGVTDGTNLGGHGSNTIVRTRESLAKDVVTLSPSGEKPPVTGPPPAPSFTGDPAHQVPALQDQAGQHHMRGDIAEKSGDSLSAVREYQKAAELDPSEPNFFDWGAELLLHRAVEPAIEVFSKGTRLFPRSARMLVALGVSRYSNGSYDQAAQRLCEASDLDPADPQPYLFLGKIQSVETNQSECSVERLKRFVKLQPENALANFYYGVNLWKRRKGPDDTEAAGRAESYLRRAVELDPKLGVGYLQLGVLYSEGKDFPRAISSYQTRSMRVPSWKRRTTVWRRLTSGREKKKKQKRSFAFTTGYRTAKTKKLSASVGRAGSSSTRCGLRRLSLVRKVAPASRRRYT